MTVPFWAWAAFGAVVLIMLTVDLLAHRGAHIIKFKEAAIWSAVWVGVSLAFAGAIWATMGSGPAVDFTTAWLLEKSPQRRQPVRLRTDLRVLQGPARVPAPGAVLRRHRRTRLPRHLPRRRCGHRQHASPRCSSSSAPS